MPNIDAQNLAASLRRLGAVDGSDITAAIDRAVEACVDLFGVDGSGLMVADEQNTLHYVASSDGPGRAATAQAPDGTPVRAGVVKAGIGYWSIGAFEQRVLAAVAATWARTGAAVMVHLEHGSAAFEVLRALEVLGVPASAVALAHIDRNPDPGLHAELAAAGAYLGYDGWARSQRWPDSVLLDCLVRTAQAGGAERLLVGGDVARATRYRAYGGMPGLAYLGERVVPRLEREAPAHLVDLVLRTNPARWLAGEDDHAGREPDQGEDT